MSIKNTIESRGFVRASKRHTAAKQIARLKSAGCGEVYVDGEALANLRACINSLRAGDTLMVTSLGRLHNTRQGVRAAVEQVVKIGARIMEVDAGRTIDASGLHHFQMAMDAADELANDKRRWSSKDAREAALTRWERWEKTPRNKAESIWRNIKDFPTIGSALAHPDMAGWTQNASYRAFGKRGTALWDKEKYRANMKVYVAQAGKDRKVKIGTTGNIDNRTNGIGHSLVKGVRIIAAVPGGYDLERELHQRFKEYRIRGEWFRLEGDLAEYVAGLPKYEDKTRRRRRRS
jgi:hypothetical protein